jgi:hypothetical protein
VSARGDDPGRTALDLRDLMLGWNLCGVEGSVTASTRSGTFLTQHNVSVSTLGSDTMPGSDLITSSNRISQIDESVGSGQ